MKFFLKKTYKKKNRYHHSLLLLSGVEVVVALSDVALAPRHRHIEMVGVVLFVDVALSQGQECGNPNHDDLDSHTVDPDMWRW